MSKTISTTVILFALAIHSTLSADDTTTVRVVEISKVFSGSHKVNRLEAERNTSKAVSGPQTISPRRVEYQDVIRKAQKVIEKLKTPELSPKKRNRLSNELAEIKMHGKLLEREFEVAAKEQYIKTTAAVKATRAELLVELRTVTESLIKAYGWTVVIFQDSEHPQLNPIIRDKGSVISVSDIVTKRWNQLEAMRAKPK